jgi:hypothetical protein
VDWGVIVGLIVIGLVLWYLLYGKPAAEFVIEIQDGTAQLKDGTVTQALLNELTEQCLAAGIRTSEVRGLGFGSHIRLWFAKEFPPELRQRLHNWWALHGWRRGKLHSEAQRR